MKPALQERASLLVEESRLRRWLVSSRPVAEDTARVLPSVVSVEAVAAYPTVCLEKPSYSQSHELPAWTSWTHCCPILAAVVSSRLEHVALHACPPSQPVHSGPGRSGVVCTQSSFVVVS